jgi:hypothetical protein
VTAKRITRAATEADLADLLARPPNTSLAFVTGSGVDATPVAFLYRDGKYLVKPPQGLETGAEAALLVDEGLYHTELRGVLVRGVIGEAAADGWAEVVPARVTAWDYGAMRERASDASG